jgi:hypothetical protein
MSFAVITQQRAIGTEQGNGVKKTFDPADCGPFRIGTADRQTMATSGGGHPGQAGTVHRLSQAADRIWGEQIAAEIELGENKQLYCLGRRKATDSFQASQVFVNRRFTARLPSTLPERQANSQSWLGGSGTQKGLDAILQIHAEIGMNEQGGQRPIATSSTIL